MVIARRQIKDIRQSSRLPEYLEAADVNTLIAAAPHARARILILIQWRAGLRISEAVNLRVADLRLNSEHPTLIVRRGKGNRPRVVPVHPELRVALTNILEYGGVRDGKIVGVSRTTGWRWMQRAAENARAVGALDGSARLGTHTLRHSAARHWLSHGIPINVVSRWLGHASLQTTLIYLEILPDPLGKMERVP